VIVLRAVGRIIHDVKFGGEKGRLACHAHEAFFVVATCEAAVGGFDGFTIDVGAAAAAFSFAGGCLKARRTVGVGGSC
jgi:hypothetical protein